VCSRSRPVRRTKEIAVQELENIGAITLFVADVERARQWYQRAVERPVVHEDGESAC
jgi:catechol-2,3-dioxygenase